MEKLKCPSCGSPNIEQIDIDKYQCPYCGKSFSDPAKTNTKKNINIHGYTQIFAINPDIEIYLNGKHLGNVGENKIFQIKVEGPCQLKFKCLFRSTTINVNPELDRDIYLSFDRVSGRLIAQTTQNIQSINQNIESLDKPKIGLILLSFLIPILGFFFYIDKKKQYPKSAQTYLKGAIIGFLIGFLINLLLIS